MNSIAMHAIKNSELSFEDFYAESKNKVLRAVVAATGDDHDAEDCTAEAFRKALENWSEIQYRNSPAAWVVRTAVNLHIDRFRRHQRTLKLLPDLLEDEVVAAPALPIDPKFLQAIQELPERQRQVIALRVLLGLSGEQTAAELEISVGSVGTHLHRALATLRTFLASQDSEEKS